VTGRAPAPLPTSPDTTKTTRREETDAGKGRTATTGPWHADRRRNSKSARFRQHVNPLARLYQQPTLLTPAWPSDAYAHVAGRPLHVDIGCGKGGFLLDYVKSLADRDDRRNDGNDDSHNNLNHNLNYLGLEIRPLVAQYAKERVAGHGLQHGTLDFLGCNANVDLARLLERYQAHYNDKADNSPDHDNTHYDCLARVSIQFPDPHFKKPHAKRRVVTDALVDTIARYMPVAAADSPADRLAATADKHTTGVVFLQSDVQSVLDTMGERFLETPYFARDTAVWHAAARDDARAGSPLPGQPYVATNPLGVPTERETSVLDKGLPVYRLWLQRTATPWGAAAPALSDTTTPTTSATALDRDETEPHAAV
jgi:tRNA (guanine-N7-)-methyltransferase